MLVNIEYQQQRGTHALQQFCEKLSQGETSDGWVTLVTGTESEMQTLNERPYADRHTPTQRIIEL